MNYSNLNFFFRCEEMSMVQCSTLYFIIMTSSFIIHIKRKSERKKTVSINVYVVKSATIEQNCVTKYGNSVAECGGIIFYINGVRLGRHCMYVHTHDRPWIDDRSPHVSNYVCGASHTKKLEKKCFPGTAALCLQQSFDLLH